MPPELSAILGAILLSLGIVAAPTDFAGGMFLAVAMAFLAMAWSQPHDRKSYIMTLATAVIIAIAAAIARDQLMPRWSLQFVMATAGLFSRYLAESALSFGRSLREEAGGLPARLVRKWFGKDPGDA